MRARFTVGGLLVIAPSVALAHGEQIIAAPVGQAVAIVTIALVAFAMRLSWKQRSALIVVPLLMCPLFWLVPHIGEFVGEHFGYDEAPWFLYGVLTTLATGTAVLVMIRRIARQPNKARQP